MTRAVLEAQNLLVQRNGNTILDIDELQVFSGEVLAVIGPNGAGKSTLLLTLSRLLEPDRGQIIFRAGPIEAIKPLVYRRQIALVLQAPLLLDKSVHENVAEGLRYRRIQKSEVQQRVKEWLEKLEIQHLAQRRASRLSGGEAQRVSLARAFAIQPQVLMLDEPFSALDAPTRARLLEDFHGLLQDTGVTTLFITHDLDEALFLSDRVAVMLDGRLRQVGPPQDVFSAPADPDVAAFVGVETVIAGHVVASRSGQITIQADGFLVEAVGDVALGRRVFACLRPEDVTLLPCSDAPADSSPRSSARNSLRGRILRLVPQGPLVKVIIDCGFKVTALITRLSAQEMELETGRAIDIAFKASAVHLIPR